MKRSDKTLGEWYIHQLMTLGARRAKQWFKELADEDLRKDARRLKREVSRLEQSLSAQRKVHREEVVRLVSKLEKHHAVGKPITEGDVYYISCHRCGQLFVWQEGNPKICNGCQCPICGDIE